MRTHCQQHCSKQLQANTQCLPLSKAVRQQIHWCFYFRLQLTTCWRFVNSTHLVTSDSQVPIPFVHMPCPTHSINA